MCHQLLVIFTAECRGCVWTEACRARTALGPIPLPLWPLHGRGQPALTAQPTIPWTITIQKCAEWHKIWFYIPWLSRVRSKPCACDTESLNLENDLYEKSSSPKSLLSPSNMYYPIKQKIPLVWMAQLFPWNTLLFHHEEIKLKLLNILFCIPVAHFDHWSPL